MVSMGMTQERELIIFKIKRRHKDIWATFLFGLLTLTYFLIRWHTRSLETETTPILKIDEGFKDVINNLLRTVLANNQYNLKIKIPRREGLNSSTYLQNILDHFNWSTTATYFLIISSVICLSLYEFNERDVVPSLMVVVLVVTIATHFNVFNFIFFLLIIFFYRHYVVDALSSYSPGNELLPNLIRYLFKAFFFIAFPMGFALWFVFFQIRFMTNSFVFYDLNITVEIFIVFYFIVSLLVSLFTLGLYFVTVFYFLINAFEIADVFKTAKYTIQNVFYTFGAVCFYSFTFYTNVIRRESCNTFQTVMETDKSIIKICKSLYAVSTYCLLPIKPFYALLKPESFDFIVCLAFFGRRYKKTKEKVSYIEKNTNMSKIKATNFENYLLGMVLFAILVTFFISSDLISTYKIEQLTDKSSLIKYMFLGRSIVHSYFVMLSLNSFVCVLQYAYVFTENLLKHNDYDLFSLFPRKKSILLIVTVL